MIKDVLSEVVTKDNTMMSFIRRAALALISSSTVNKEQDLEIGERAYLSGDYATAMRKLRPVAEQGNANAQHYLGEMYQAGKVVEQDYAEAAKWFQLAAKQGNYYAQHCLGTLYEYGDGVVEDTGKALSWYRLAAEQGYTLSRITLASSYLYGEGVAQDYTQALYWYRELATDGYPFAYSCLGEMYENGTGVAQDYVTAHMWYNLAAATGDEDFRKKRDSVAKLMTSDAIAEAQQRARICKQSGNTGYPEFCAQTW